MNKDQLGIFNESDLPESAKRKSGYRSTDYIVGGFRANKVCRTESQLFVRYFLETIYNYRGIDYYIPKHKIAKYYARAKAIIEKLGSIERAKKYIDWYITDDSFIKNAFNFDLMVTGSVVDRFEVSNRGKKIDAAPEGYIGSIDEAKNNKGGVIL